MDRKLGQLSEKTVLLHYEIRGFLGCFAMVARAARRLQAATEHDGITIDGLTKLLDDHDVKRPKTAKEGTLGWYVKGRDWLEHRDERLPRADTERKHEYALRHEGDSASIRGAYSTLGGDGFTWLIWNLDGDTLRMGNTDWPLGDTALQLLDRFVEEIDRIVRRYAVQRFREDGKMLAR